MGRQAPGSSAPPSLRGILPRSRLVLVALGLSLVLATGGCAPRAAPPANATPPPPAPVVQPTAPVVEPPMPPAPAAQPPPDYRFPAHGYRVEGPGVHLVAPELSVCLYLDAYGEWANNYVWQYWFIDVDPVTIEIRFAEAMPYPAAAIGQLREALREAIILEEGHAADRVFVRAHLPPGRYEVRLLDVGMIGSIEVLRPGLILDRGRPFRLMYWEPGGTPEILGEYALPYFADLPSVSLALPVAEREEAFFSAYALGGAKSLWRWQRSGQPPSFRPLPVTWTGWTAEVTSVRRDGVVIENRNSVVMVGAKGEPVATLVEQGNPYGTAVGPGGEIAVFLLETNNQGALELDLTIFSATLEKQQTWAAVYPHGRFNDGIPRVKPIWTGNDLLFVALDDRKPPDERPTYNLMAFDVTTGSVQHILGPFDHAWRSGQTHYIFEKWQPRVTIKFDAATRSSRILPAAIEAGSGSPSYVSPIAVNGEWVVFRSDSHLLAWHPTAGVTPLGSGREAFAMGVGFAWWIGLPWGH
ncbi:MAG TPA: hypothetical protein VLK32_03870 [Bacillota bacterium]|nr:hypothetical protein [Bacillota bacterium]